MKAMTAMTARTGTQRGITLVELLAALVISALVVTLASRILLTGQRQYLARMFETDRLSALLRMKGALHQALGGRIAACGSGRLALDTDSTDLDLAAWFKARHPGADSLVFECLEVDEALTELVAWKGRFQPHLVAYRACLEVRGRTDCLAGSVLK